MIAYKVAVPKVYAEYGNVLKLTYYDMSDNKVDIYTIPVSNETVTQYYCKVTLNEGVAGAENYRVVNETNGSDFAKYTFYVGNDDALFDIEYDAADEIIYDGETHGIEAKPAVPGFDYAEIGSKYYKVTYGEDGTETRTELPEGELPKEVGDYLVIFDITNKEEADGIAIRNNVTQFSIK